MQREPVLVETGICLAICLSTSFEMKSGMPEPAENLPSSDQRVNVLLVDDHPDNLVVLEAILADLEVNLLKADSGELALLRLLENDFAVILLDVQMRGMDGFETAKLMRSRAKSSRTPVIFLTAYESDRFPVEQAYALGAVDYLVKPLVPVILRAKVLGFVELYRRTEQIKQQAEQLRQMERQLADEALEQQQKESIDALQDSERRSRALAESLREADRRKDEFLATLAHELRNPSLPSATRCKSCVWPAKTPRCRPKCAT